MGVEAVTKKLCRIEVEKECVTKTKTFKKFVEYKDSEDCKEIEVCKHELPLPYHGPFHHKREAEPHHPYFVECEKRPRPSAGRNPSSRRSPRTSSCADPSQARCARTRRSRCPAWSARSLRPRRPRPSNGGVLLTLNTSPSQ